MSDGVKGFMAEACKLFLISIYFRLLLPLLSVLPCAQAKDNVIKLQL